MGKAMTIIQAGLGLLLASCQGQAAEDLNPVTLHPAPTHEPVPLVKEGKAVGRVRVMTPEPSRMLRAAVRDLGLHIEYATGAKLPVDKTGEAEGPAILIGACDAAAEIGLDAAKLPVEGFAIKTAPGAIHIVGHDDHGTTWGIYEFLERFVGVRWYWPEDRKSKELLGTSIPARTDLILQPVWLTDAPAFRKREIWPSGGPRVAPADVGALHRRLRSADTWPVKLIVHAPHGWAKHYKDDRPEIFQLRKDGERDFDMLCYGHPRTLETYLEEIEAQRQPEGTIDRGRRILRDTSITVSPADMAVSCRCEHCRKLWDSDGGTYGTASKVLATFVAKLAREVEKRWPDMTIIFLPYKNYTYAPKGVTFPGNVEIQICGMPGLAQYKDAKINAAEQANIDAWVALSGRKIQNWHYSCWPADRTKAAYLFPHTIQAHYQANLDKTVGSFINGVENHWPRQHVSLYIWMKVLWNPDFNVDAAIGEYVRRMYGPAAGSMGTLVRMLIDGWEQREWPEHTFSPKSVYHVSYPRADVEQMEALLAQALAQAEEDPLATRRIESYAKSLRPFFAESELIVEGKGLKPLVVWQTAEASILDGRLDEACWTSIKPVSFVRARDRKEPEPAFPTELKAVWTRKGIFFGFRMHEPTPGKLKRDIRAGSRDASLIWWNDNVEIFLDVTGERSGYYQFIVNANGAIFDSKGKDTSWTAKGLKAAGHVGKDFWSLEVYVPYSVFPDARAPGTGVEWFGNFTRHRVTDRKHREYQRLNTTFAAPSNDQNAFGPIRFVEK